MEQDKPLDGSSLTQQGAIATAPALPRERLSAWFGSVFAGGRDCTKPGFQTRALFAVRRSLKHLRHTRRILVSACRSFHAHIQIQFSKAGKLGDQGCAYQYDEQGRFRANTRTGARILYTERLLKACPWIDLVDMETFLMGFDAGEQWASGREDWDTPLGSKSDRTSAWLTPSDGDAIRGQLRGEFGRSLGV